MIEATLPMPGTDDLKAKLARISRIAKLKSLALVLPLVLFLLLTFLAPIAAMLGQSVKNPEVVNALPATLAAISQWQGKDLPDEAVYAALAADLGRKDGQATA